MRLGLIILINQRRRTARVLDDCGPFSERQEKFRALRSGKETPPDGDYERMLLMDLEGVIHGRHRFRKVAEAAAAASEPRRPRRRADAPASQDA